MNSLGIYKIRYCKVKLKQTQIQTIFDYLQDNLATASMVSTATGIPRSSVYAYKRRLAKADKLTPVMKFRCRQTGYKAWYLIARSKKELAAFLDNYLYGK